MKKIIKLVIFSLTLLGLFGCRQRHNAGEDESKSFKITFENPQFGTLSAKKKDGSTFTSGQMAKENEVLTFVVTPSAGHVVDAWKVARQDKDNSNKANRLFLSN